MTAPRPEPARHRPGGAYAVAAPHGLALLAAEAEVAVVEGVWRVLAAGGGPGDVLDAATGAGGRFADLPPLALLFTGDPARVLLRGAVEARVTDAAGRTCVLSGAGVATWAEHVVADAHAVTLTVLPAEADTAPGLPLVDGVARADAITGELRSASVDDGDARADVSAAGAAGAGTRADAAPVDAAPAADAASVAAAPPVAGAAAPGGLAAAGVPAAGILAEVPAWVTGDVEAATPHHAVAPGAGGAPAGDDGPADAAGEGAVAADAEGTPTGGDAEPLDTVKSDSRGRFAHLWGETVMSSVAAAAVAEPAEDDDAAPDAGARPAAADAAAPTPPIGAPAIEPAAPDAAAGPPLVRAGDHDGATLSLAAARALRAQRAGDLPPVPAPPVPGPPAVGRLELSTGRTLLLDRDVVIGRRPRATRVGGEAPQLITVESPSQDISRSHIEVRREGESAVVVDLDTTNGTVLHRDGVSPMRLHPGEATILLDGDALDLGDEVTVTYREG